MVRRFRKSINSLIPLKKFVYLISPNRINKKFYGNLDKVLSYGNVKFFQLRLKKVKNNNLLNTVKIIRKITLKYKVKLMGASQKVINKAEDRELFMKLYVDEMEPEEVSRQTGMKKDVIYNRVSRGKRKIRKLFSGQKGENSYEQ